ncbi:DNA-processing protein DprA [Moraxella pluranimalium]|uniref:DNA protecting protein DprA n=1 Tax=Moraxella pluranimalium TaxID=470453 RepID=A0A1T0CEZ2_9GAMM|nr:DNA-processing protein DprA [Moraxella pluranimalium]OOS20894.1 DNA protecting protein DprA [Moraxella pluranimalium]
MSYQALTDTQAVLALWYVTNTSLVSYYKLVAQFGDAKSALLADIASWQQLAIHAAHQKRWQDSADVIAFVQKVFHEVALGSYAMSFVGDANYPKALAELYDPPPVLFYRGNIDRLNDKQIAIVGSRNPTEHAQKITFDMAQYLVQAGFSITSGLAQGIDRQAHMGALAQMVNLAGRTVGVMGTGIDVIYPRNHNALFAQIIQDGGCLISELLPSTPASKHTFPRRNRLVAGLSMATIVTEAALQSGSLITARLAAEQGKQVFAVPSRIDNANAEGCHHLIREGATLVYHPDQIIEDLSNQSGEFFNALPKSFSQGVSVYTDIETVQNLTTNQTISKNTQHSPAQTATMNTHIPEHLQAIYQLMTAPMDIDALVMASGQGVGELLAALMELEILGLVQQAGGRYARV